MCVCARRRHALALRDAQQNTPDKAVHILNPHHLVNELPSAVLSPSATTPVAPEANGSAEAATAEGLPAVAPAAAAGAASGRLVMMPDADQAIHLLAAIASADEAALVAAIKVATPTHSGTLDPSLLRLGYQALMEARPP